MKAGDRSEAAQPRPAMAALISSAPGPAAPALAVDLEAVGIRVVADVDCSTLLHATVAHAPDLIVCFDPCPSDELFAAVAAIQAAAPRPLVVFTTDPDAGRIERAALAGVDAYVVDGYAVQRLRSVIHVAQARFRRDQKLRDELAEVTRRFGERTLVDRAKGILMGARQVREADAYGALRAAAMRTKQRIGQVSRHVIEAARYAEAINRAGQLRMLSQRLVKLRALECAAPGAGPRALLADSAAQVEANLAALARILSQATFGDLIDAVIGPWQALRAALRQAPAAGALAELDRLAEAFLASAEQLTRNLEIAGFGPGLHVINVSGRQRMLSQRLAKEALLGALPGGGAATRPARTEAEFTDALAYLRDIPLTNAAIAEEYAAAVRTWELFRAALSDPRSPAGLAAVAETSEALLAHFDRLTDHYERGMQVLV